MKTQARGPADLAAYMQSQALPGEILRLNAPTPTVETAAQAAGTSPAQIVKSILFLVDSRPVLVIACGTAYVNYRALAAHFGVSRKKVKLAAPETVLEITGFEVGAMPPFGHRTLLPALMDRRVLEQGVVYAGGGADDTLLRLSPQDMLSATRAEVIDLLTPPASAQAGAAG